MKKVELEDDVYNFLLKNTSYIGESASSILRRILPINPDKSHLYSKKSAQNITKLNEEKINQDYKKINFNDKIIAYFQTYKKSQNQLKTTEKFLLTLSFFYSQVGQNNYKKLLNIKGRSRIYFAKTQKQLLDCAKSSCPRKIPNCDFWVMTNFNSTRKYEILKEVRQTLKIPPDNFDLEKILK